MKIEIVVEDKLNGGVEITSKPKFENLAMGIEGGLITSSAAAYAIFMLNAARGMSKSITKGQGNLPMLKRRKS